MDDIHKIKVAAYCRVSTDSADQLSSLETQKMFFEEYTALHRYELTKLYADEGISGTKLKNRKAFNRMMEDARNGKFERVFVKDISRFARNAVDFLQSIRELKAMGIKCEFVNASLSTEDGEFTLGILALVAQEESANISKRVKFGKKKNAEKGKVPNFVYGYDKQAGELFTLHINPAEAETVKRIFDYYVNDEYGANKIAQLLNSEGLTTKRGCRWSQNAVSRILQNPIYTGVVINGREEVEDFLTGIRIKKPDGQWMINRNEALQIISGELFERTQKLMEERRRAYQLTSQRRTGRYPFSSLIKCSCCGYSFRRVSRQFKYKNYVKWVCSSRNANGKEFCPNHIAVDEAELMDAIRSYLCSFIGANDKFIHRITQELKQQYDSMQETEDRVQLEKELASLQKTKQKQTQMYEIDAISLAELKTRTAQLNQKIERCSCKLELLKQSFLRRDGIEAMVRAYCRDAERLLSHEVLDHQLMCRVIDRIIVKETGEVEIYLNFRSD